MTFGGAYSSHIVATAAAGRVFGFKTIGIVRGEEPRTLSHSLRDAMGFGMDLFFVSRTDYRNKIWPAKLLKKPDEPYVINEGGYGPTGVEGAMEILDFCEQEHYSHIACAVGTSTMMAGLIKTSLTGQQVLGFSVLKNNLNLEKDLCNLLSPGDREKKFQVIHDYHFGGYAKYTRELIGFMNEFYQASLIPLDFVYTAKLFFGVIAMMENNYFPPGSHVLLIHSGGLQGNLSLPKGALVF